MMFPANLVEMLFLVTGKLFDISKWTLLPNASTENNLVKLVYILFYTKSIYLH